MTAQGQPRALVSVVAPLPLSVHFLPGQGRRLIVSFAGVGKTRDRAPPPEFLDPLMQGDAPVLFVADTARSWLNAPGLDDAIARTIAVIAEECGATELIALGNSMGATMALLMARHVPFSQIVALSPQVSVDPTILPDETRWRFLRNRIETFRYPTVAPLPEAPQIVILHADSPDELRHAARIPHGANVAHFVLPGYDHRMADTLAAQGHLPDLLDHALAGRRRKLALQIKSLGGRFLQPEERQPLPVGPGGAG